MREDLQRRIGTALDSPEGIDGDAELRATLDGDPEAAAYARDLRRLGDALRDWPLPEPSDEGFESLAQRIEQRLSDALPRIADPTLAPQFDDDDDLRDATAGLLGPVIASGEFELDELHSVPPPAAPPVAPVVMKARPPAPPPSASPEGRDRPAATAAPAPREMPTLVRGGDGDRLSFPAPPPSGAPSLRPVGQLPPQRKARGPVGLFAALAAAAVVGLGVFATTTMYSGEPLAAPAPSAASTGATGAADLEERIEQGAPAEEPAAMAATPLAAPAPPAAPIAAAAAAEPDGRAIGGSARGRAGAAGDRGDDLEAWGLMEGARSGGGGGALADDAPAVAAPRQRALRRAPMAVAPESASPSATTARAPGPAREEVRAQTQAPPRASAGEASGAGTSSGAPRGGSGGSGATATTSTPRDLPAAPERGAVLSAIQAIEPAVRACAESEHGTATVRIVVAGSGRVTTATVSGQFAGTPVGSCVARAVRTGRFPQFSGDRFEVTYPFQL